MFLIVSPTQGRPQRVIIIPRRKVPTIIPRFNLPFHRGPFRFNSFRQLRVPFLTIQFLIRTSVFRLRSRQRFITLEDEMRFNSFQNHSPNFTSNRRIIITRDHLLRFLRRFVRLQSITNSTFLKSFSSRISSVRTRTTSTFDSPTVRRHMSFLTRF